MPGSIVVVGLEDGLIVESGFGGHEKGMFDRVPLQTAQAVGGVMLLCVASVFGDVAEDIGLDALQARLGADVPTGAAVTLAQVEAPQGSNYAPDADNDHFTSLTIYQQSGSFGASSHATNVAQWMCGNQWSPAPGVSNLYCWEVVDWCTNGFLQAQSTAVQPNGTPNGIKNFNLSWIASFGNLTNDHRVLRRADFVVERDDVLMCSGISNEGQDAYPLMMCMFNGLSVGVTDGEHNADDTMDPYDGPDRMRPEIVAPLGTTSAATGLVSGCAAVLVETARSDASLPVEAESSEVIKAALIAGAVKTTPDENWTNNPGTGAERGIADRPLDETYGAGTVNIDRSHRIISGGRVWGGIYSNAPGEAGLHGFDQAFCLAGNSRWWRFSIGGLVEEVSIAATWNRIVNTSFTGYSMGDGEIRLWRIAGDGSLTSLVGDQGLDVFAEGNVVSRSDVANLELLFLRDLAPGDYMLELHHNAGSGASSLTAGVAWHFSDPEPVDVLGDVNGDGFVNITDLLLVIANWGCFGECIGDVTGDDTVDVSDLLLVIANWGG